jgi:hypothetical protein
LGNDYRVPPVGLDAPFIAPPECTVGRYNLAAYPVFLQKILEIEPQAACFVGGERLASFPLILLDRFDRLGGTGGSLSAAASAGNTFSGTPKFAATRRTGFSRFSVGAAVSALNSRVCPSFFVFLSHLFLSFGCFIRLFLCLPDRVRPRVLLALRTDTYIDTNRKK